jgi:hypothetical protein
MWIFTDTGFVSAVRKPWAKDQITLRARDKKSLTEFVDAYGVSVITSKDSDYPHRVVLDDADYKDWLFNKVDDLNYDNFKNQVAKTRGRDYAHLLSNVWADMLGATDLEREEEDPSYKSYRKNTGRYYHFNSFESDEDLNALMSSPYYDDNYNIER